MIEENGELPINVKIIVEGEEECGSMGLDAVLEKHQAELKADYLAIVDMGLPDAHTPAVTLGCRGLIAMEMLVKGSNTDLHSGSHGGIVYNPNHALVEILSKLRDTKGRITVPGFYDDVAPVPDEVHKSLYLHLDEEKYKKDFGAVTSGGEEGYSPIEREWLRPTVEINGICGGYTGPGFKTVIPAEARAKISCRLVPNQELEKIGPLVANYLQSLAPRGLEVTVTILSGGKPVRASPESKVVKAFFDAYAEIFNKPCKYAFSGGSIPIAERLAHYSQSEIVLVGFGLPDDKIHAPNEHFGVDRIEKGFHLITKALLNLGGQ